MSPSVTGSTAPTRPDAPEDHSEGTPMSATDTMQLPAADELGTSAPPPPDQAGAARSRTRVRPLPAVLAVLALVSAVAVGVLGVQAWTLSQAQKDEAAALEAARTRTVQVLSYDPKTVDADVARAKEQLSGGFAAQFDQLANVLILPSAKHQGLSSTVEVKNAAMIDAQSDRAEVLLLLHQKVSSNASPQPIEGTIQVKTTLSRSPDGQWLISNLQPLS